MLTTKRTLPAFALVTLMVIGSCSSDDDDDTSALGETGSLPDETSTEMSFFLTSASPGDGGNLGGLAGADAHCGNLAEAVGVTGKEWRAYLSTTGPDGINASERIGDGPWVNANNVVVADSVTNLLSDSNNINQETAITENRDEIGGVGDSPNRHDILTGTELNGLASTDLSIDSTCSNWTSNSIGAALVGHHDRMGGGANPTSWSTAHPSIGCSQADLIATAGDGLFYCFATN